MNPHIVRVTKAIPDRIRGGATAPAPAAVSAIEAKREMTLEMMIAAQDAGGKTADPQDALVGDSGNQASDTVASPLPRDQSARIVDLEKALGFYACKCGDGYCEVDNPESTSCGRRARNALTLASA